MLQKPNKLDYTTVKSHQAISLFNCFRKVCVKLVADMLSEWCEIDHVLREDQMKSRRQENVIDIVARVIALVQEAWSEEKLESMLLIDVKGAFHHVS